jgi:hypothetical protein
VAYALVTCLLVGVYVGLVLLATDVLEVSSPVAVAASTLLAAALFNPLRRQVQQLVDRRSRAGADPCLGVEQSGPVPVSWLSAFRLTRRRKANYRIPHGRP